MKELSGLVAVLYNWVVMVVQLNTFPRIVVHPTGVDLSGMQAISQLPFNTASAIYRGLYCTTRMPLLLQQEYQQCYFGNVFVTKPDCA